VFLLRHPHRATVADQRMRGCARRIRSLAEGWFDATWLLLRREAVIQNDLWLPSSDDVWVLAVNQGWLLELNHENLALLLDVEHAT
jgi:hypothetical protein